MYTDNLYNYKRHKTHEVRVGDVTIGGKAKVVIQTMTSTATNDIDGTVEQIIKCMGAGAQLVRITVPSMKDIEHLQSIRDKLNEYAYSIPLVADIHFNQKIAFEAAKIVDKVRINPGNFADTKKFTSIDYTDSEYSDELLRLKEAFLPLLDICRQHNTALRIGTNHGSLSDRIMSRYGDTPMGMAESAMEFLRICQSENFQHVVVSMKSSNTLVMVQAVRLLVSMMNEEKMSFPLHLGVTEAGEGEDGRIKSALGIGALLADGIGDTIRVSLTEAPEEEIPVAKLLLKSFVDYEGSDQLAIPDFTPKDPYTFLRRKTEVVDTCGGNNPPVVISNVSKDGFFPDLKPDYCFIDSLDMAINKGDKYILPLNSFNESQTLPSNIIPLVNIKLFKDNLIQGPAFIIVGVDAINDDLINQLKGLTGIGIVLTSKAGNKTAAFRWAITQLMTAGIHAPVILKLGFDFNKLVQLQITAAAQLGALLVDGLCDGIWLSNSEKIPEKELAATAFNILQAGRMRVTRPEYISCPSCGRTQFNIQDTTRKIRTETAHLKGLKIGVMGCIVNGLGEMADADYGYIGGAPGKVNLYHHKELVKRGVPELLAVDELIVLIKEKGDWVEPNS